MDLDNIVVPDDISVQSNEERIVIDPITRVINIPGDYIIGVESDEKSDRMYFQCPKIVGDNVDLSKLKLYVNFENANKERDNYFVNDVTVSEGNILFSWLFSRKVTKYKGDVKFIVCAKKSEDSLTLEWNTTVAKGLSLEGIEVELSDEEQSIASDYLIQLEKELSALAETENNRLLTTSSNQITNITNKGSEQVQLVENASKKALDSIPSTYTELQKQVDTIESVTNSSATGIVETTHTTNGYKYLGNSAEKPFVDLEYIVDTKHLIDSLYNTINRSLGINSIDNDVVGVQINYSAGTNTRLAGAIGLTPGASFDKFKMFGGRKRCNVADDGTILAYYGDDGYKEDGSNGQVMVYQPKVYYLILPLIYDKIDDVVGGYHLRKANYYVSLAERPGFKLHPAFINENGEEVDYILKSAFEGSIYDVSAGKYLTNDEQVMDATVDKLCSVANVKPCSGLTQSLTRDKVEQMAKNRGDGWHCSGIKDIALEQLLMMIELGSMNTQTNIGLGVVNVSDNTSYNCSALTGSTSSLGNTTGRATSTVVTKGTEKTTYTDDDKTSITYRGVENFWGNIWKFAEGVNFYGDGHQRGGQPYICKDFDYKEDFSSNNYEPAGFTLTNNNGYISAIGYNPNFDWLFFASESKGDSSTPVGDYLYSTPKLNDYRVALLGGRWFDGSRDGGFCLNCNDDVGTRHRAISGRLVYIPNLKNW